MLRFRRCALNDGVSDERTDEDALRHEIIRLAKMYGRYGYLYAELLADLASDHYRIEVSRHVHSMAPFGFLVNDSLSHNKHRVRFCGSHRP